MDTWSLIIAAVALLFSVGCFFLFFWNATKKAVPDEVVDKAATRAATLNLDPATIGALAKALAEAFSKVGPGALALIGAIVFLLLAGEAARVFKLTSNKDECAAKTCPGRDVTGGGRTPIAPGAGNAGSAAGNQMGNTR